MTVVAVGVCVNGMIRRAGSGIGVDGRRIWGITSPTPCEKCKGKGCPKETRSGSGPR